MPNFIVNVLASKQIHIKFQTRKIWGPLEDGRSSQEGLLLGVQLPNASTILCVWDCAFLARAMSWPPTSCSLAHVCVRCCLMPFDDVRSLMTYKIQSLAFHSSNHVHGRDKTNKLQASACGCRS